MPDTGERLERALLTLTNLGPTLRSGRTIKPDHPVSTPPPVAEAGVSPTSGDGLELRAPLGEGGMGVVLEGVQTSLGRSVAVKMLRERARGDADRRQLMREASIAALVEHPNVAPVYDLRFDGLGDPMLVMRRIEGVLWSSLLGDEEAVKQRFGEALLDWNLGVLGQVCRAAHFAHTRGIVHRDIKPSNVMIGSFGEVYLVDWGIAVRLTSGTKAEGLAGTPAYMAPEMLGDREITPQTDVYLLGAVLHELLTGAPPHPTTTPAELLASVLKPTLTFPASATAESVALVVRAMSADPGDRFQSAEAFRVALADLVRHQGSTRLTQRAHARLEELRARLALPSSGLEHDAAVHDAFGASRFGFLQALHDWPQNPEARQGLTEAVQAMGEHELRRNRPHAAALLLGELETPPPALAERVRLAKEAFEREAQQARRVARDFDPNAELQSKRWMALVFGVVTAAIPAGRQVLGIPLWLPLEIAGATVLLALTVLMGWVARKSAMKTSLNRRHVAATASVFVFELVLFALSVPLELPLEKVQVLLLFIWTLVVSAVTITLDVRMWRALPVMLACLFVAAFRVEWTDWAMSVALAAITVTLVSVWRPGAGDASGEADESSR